MDTIPSNIPDPVLVWVNHGSTQHPAVIVDHRDDHTVVVQWTSNGTTGVVPLADVNYETGRRRNRRSPVALEIGGKPERKSKRKKKKIRGADNSASNEADESTDDGTVSLASREEGVTVSVAEQTSNDDKQETKKRHRHKQKIVKPRKARRTLPLTMNRSPEKMSDKEEDSPEKEQHDSDWVQEGEEEEEDDEEEELRSEGSVFDRDTEDESRPRRRNKHVFDEDTEDEGRSGSQQTSPEISMTESRSDRLETESEEDEETAELKQKNSKEWPQGEGTPGSPTIEAAKKNDETSVQEHAAEGTKAPAEEAAEKTDGKSVPEDKAADDAKQPATPQTASVPRATTDATPIRTNTSASRFGSETATSSRIDRLLEKANDEYYMYRYFPFIDPVEPLDPLQTLETTKLQVGPQNLLNCLNGAMCCHCRQRLGMYFFIHSMEKKQVAPICSRCLFDTDQPRRNAPFHFRQQAWPAKDAEEAMRLPGLSEQLVKVDPHAEAYATQLVTRVAVEMCGGVWEFFRHNLILPQQKTTAVAAAPSNTGNREVGKVT